jgi:hypothetical protein
MRKVKVCDGLILIPYSSIEIFSLWFLSCFIGNYEITSNPKAYPVNRRLKLEFNC